MPASIDRLGDGCGTPDQSTCNVGSLNGLNIGVAYRKLSNASKYRQYVNASGHEALVCFYQQQFIERNADVYCWSPRHLSTQLLVAIRDMGHRLGLPQLDLRHS